MIRLLLIFAILPVLAFSQESERTDFYLNDSEYIGSAYTYPGNTGTIDPLVPEAQVFSGELTALNYYILQSRERAMAGYSNALVKEMREIEYNWSRAEDLFLGERYEESLPYFDRVILALSKHYEYTTESTVRIYAAIACARIEGKNSFRHSRLYGHKRFKKYLEGVTYVNVEYETVFVSLIVQYLKNKEYQDALYLTKIAINKFPQFDLFDQFQVYCNDRLK